MGGVDESTAIQAGKLLGADSIAFGSFMVLGDQVRIDSRIIGLETGEVIMAESITGEHDRFMDLIQQLGGKIAESLHARFSPATAGGGNIDAAVHFSNGVAAWDEGDHQKSEAFFSQATALDRSYQEKIDALRSGNRPTETETVPVDTSNASTEKTVEVEGMSFLSREDAVRQAQRAAVEQALGVFVQSLTEMEDYEVKKDRILSQSEGYVTRYKVIKEINADDQYIVGIRAQVSTDKIKDDLKAMETLLISMERPTVMVLMEESYPAAGMDMNFAEAELIGLLKAKRFDLVDSAQIERIRTLASAQAILNGDLEAARQLGLQLGAQYVITGKAAVQDIGEVYAGSGLRSMQASLQARIIQTRTGRLLGSTVKTAAAAHASPITGASMAVSKAVQKACDDYLIDSITHSFQDFLNNGAPIKIQINGVTTFDRNTDVTDLIAGLDRTVHVRKEGWHQTGGLLILDLRFRGTSEELARLLHNKTLADRSLEVVDVAPDRLACKIR